MHYVVSAHERLTTSVYPSMVEWNPLILVSNPYLCSGIFNQTPDTRNNFQKFAFGMVNSSGVRLRHNTDCTFLVRVPIQADKLRRE